MLYISVSVYMCNNKIFFFIVINYIADIIEAKTTFWKETYPNLTIAERKKVWHQDVYFGIRRQPEETQDVYDTFSKEWYEFAKKTEPEFDTFFEEIITDLKGYLLNLLTGKNIENVF